MLSTPALQAVAEVLGGVRQWAVVHADCAQVLPLLPARSVDHVHADPPYSEHVHGRVRRELRGGGGRAAVDGRGRGTIGPAPLPFAALAPELRRTCGVHFARVARRWLLVFSDEESRHLWQADLERAGARHVRCGLWRKLAGPPQYSGDRPGVAHEAVEIAHARGTRLRWRGGGLPAFWDASIATDRNGTGERVHATQKPVRLLLEQLQAFADPGDVVLDPFCGSASTGVACLRLGLRYIGLEVDGEVAATAHERLAAEAALSGIGAQRAGQLALFPTHSASEGRP